MTQGPRDIFHGLSCLLASLSDGSSRSLSLLQGKMAASAVPFLPILRFVEVNDDDLASPNSNEVNSAISPAEAGFDFPPSEWIPQPAVASLHQRSESNGSRPNGIVQSISPTHLEASFVSGLPVLDHPRFGAPAVNWTPIV
jgi:hypothetical protein